MKLSRALWAILTGTITGVIGVSCSTSSGTSGVRNPLGTGANQGFSGSTGNGTGATGAAGTGIGGGNAGSSGGGSLMGFGNQSNAGGGSGMHMPDGSCFGLTEPPETITVYKDASVTDTIVTYAPVALMIMQDRSSSMVLQGAGGNPMSWMFSTDAITAFVNDQQSAGIDVGVEFFPPYPSNNNNPDCSAGSDCGTPVVNFGVLPGNGPAIINAYNQATPPTGFGSPILLTPTECALRGSINTCLQHQATTGEQCVVVLVTDGTPTTCDTNQADLVKIVSDARAASGSPPTLLFFTLGLEGADLNFLNNLAQAGGTNAAINVSGGSAAFIAALNSIRQTIVNKSTHQVVHSITIQTPLECEWNIPLPPPNNQVFDKDKVNLVLAASGSNGQNGISYGRVNSAADCSKVSDGWYYDDYNNPTTIFVCPRTCNTLKASKGETVNIQFGCKTVIQPFN